jgi:hypothetical protein
VPLMLQQVRQKANKNQKEKTKINSSNPKKTPRGGRLAAYQPQDEEGDDDDDEDEEDGEEEDESGTFPSFPSASNSFDSRFSQDDSVISIAPLPATSSTIGKNGERPLLPLPSSVSPSALSVSHDLFSAPRKRKPLDPTKVIPQMPNILPVNVKDEPPMEKKRPGAGRGRRPSYSHVEDDVNTTLETSMEEAAPSKV